MPDAGMTRDEAIALLNRVTDECHDLQRRHDEARESLRRRLANMFATADMLQERLDAATEALHAAEVIAGSLVRVICDLSARLDAAVASGRSDWDWMSGQVDRLIAERDDAHRAAAQAIFAGVDFSGAVEVEP